MSILSKTKSQELKEKVENTSLPLAERKEAYNTIMNGHLNPKKAKDFDPKTFDPFENDQNIEVKRRGREEPARTLPTMGMLPKKILEGQMVGMFESKQDLYLLIAWLSSRVTTLEDKLKQHGIE